MTIDTILDGENRVVDYNEAAGELFDVDRGAAGLPAADFFGPYGESLERPGDITDIETEITLEQDGEERHYNLSVSPVRGGAEGGGGHVIVLSDVTPLKRREQELERTTARLEQFASTISHDLRNPLNVARGRLELATEDSDNEHLDHVAQAHERMESLIDDVLSLARAGDAVRESQAVELAEVVQGCWRHVETESARLVTETGGVVLADESRLQQLFENLFRNAVEHGRNDVTLTVGDLNNGFYVADDGPGIPEEERDEVLEPGYSTNEQGTGFGLSIVRDIAEAHDWDIHITEADNGGARFEFRGVELE